MKSKVASVKLDAKKKEDVIAGIERVMELGNWRNHIKGKRIFLKPNCMTDFRVPGACTSPWVLEGVIKFLRENTDAKIYFGDADSATARKFEKMVKSWGYDKIARKYGVKIVNLSKAKIVKAKAGGKIFKEIDVPKILLDVDCIVTLPVMKTHVLTTMTCALKNQWGCLTRVRQQYHQFADQCIAEINSFLNVTFVIADATVCMEGMGPGLGYPIAIDSLFATHDPVAMDSLACDVMMIDKKKVGQLRYGKMLGVGTDEYSVVGDPIKPVKFKPAEIKKNIIVTVEMMLRRVPGLRYIIFKTPFFRIPAWIATQYNHFNYRFVMKRRTIRFLKKNSLYMNEFRGFI